jgi:hypothetical protein
MKKTFVVLLASFVVFALFACTKGSRGEPSPFRLGRGSVQPADGKTASGKTYSLGDSGPADGIIFYDKKEYTNGWRYLEAAPAGTEFTAEWGSYTFVAGTEILVGSGKRNTELIVAVLKENGNAAQLCANLNVNGHKDWFLPSMSELDLLYKNLKLMGLGSFKDDWYWSSSASEYGSIAAWAQKFSDGSRNDYNHKGNAFLVRAVRAF